MTASAALDTRVPPLDGRLPPQCARDVESLRRFVHSTISRSSPAAPVSPREFKEVLLTGANGFVGRFLLRALLRQNPSLVVHCLVRGDSTEHAFGRLRSAMEHAEIWEEEFAPRLRLVTGDICRERLGSSDADFASLCERIDAVYHFAADLSLLSSYSSIRTVNTLSLRNIFDLCLRTRLKHVFYASSMGVFPEYFCDFSKEFRDAHIGHHMQPRIASMKKLFPLGVIGYPWSKLVAEQSLLYANAAGMPTGIFRLPQTAMSSTGFVQNSGVTLRLYCAAIQLEMAPRGFSIQRNAEPVDTLCEACAAISMNPKRRFTVYHCCDPQPPHDDFQLEDFGIYLSEVSYRTFRQAGQAMGKSSPLHGFWDLVDYFAPYWYGGKRADVHMPVSDRAMREDCPHPVKWPALLIRHARSHEWIRRPQNGWPYPPPVGRLDFDRLVAQAEIYARRLGVDHEQANPEWMRTGLERLVGALKAPEAGVRPEKIPHLAYTIHRILRGNVALARELREHPEIRHEKIVRPVFIMGINRTGTTFLHRLMARDSRFWTLRRYELAEPVLSSGEYATVAGSFDDPRRAHMEEILSAAQIAEKVAEMHRVDIDEPEEDFPLLRLSFTTWTETVEHHVPGYARWLAATGSRNAYAHHRRAMQHFTWQRLQRASNELRTWLLKMPLHLMELETLVETYPDALFIQTHRDPVQVMGSWNSLVERIRSFSMEPRPPHDTGGGAARLHERHARSSDAISLRPSRAGVALGRRALCRSGRRSAQDREVHLSALRLGALVRGNEKHGEMAAVPERATPAGAAASVPAGGLRSHTGIGECRLRVVPGVCRRPRYRAMSGIPGRRSRRRRLERTDAQ